MQLSTIQHLGQRQSMVVSAQLQQAIHLLQMGNAELHNFIEEQAEENPFLELAAPAAPEPALPAPASRASAAPGDDWDRIAALPDDRGASLYAHAEAHVQRLGLAGEEAAAAAAYLDALEPSGRVSRTPEHVADGLGIDPQLAERVLRRLQEIEPAGLFARDLAECLRLQAEERGMLTPLFEAVLDNLPKLAAADIAGLARACRCGQAELRDVLRQLRSLDPKPGARFADAPAPIAPPDLIVSRAGEGWAVDLNRSTLPSVVIRKAEATRLGRGRVSAAGYITERLSLARWLSRALEHRNQTALKIGAEIVRRQADFMEHGPSRLRPMILKDVAEAVGVHESTVSRVTTGLMMATPQGAFPLKYFFTAALPARVDAEPESAGAVRHRIGQLIRGECPQKPLSDDAIARIMSEEGVRVARRTVAKYREQLNIPASGARRRQAIVSGRI